MKFRVGNDVQMPIHTAVQDGRFHIGIASTDIPLAHDTMHKLHKWDNVALPVLRKDIKNSNQAYLSCQRKLLSAWKKGFEDMIDRNIACWSNPPCLVQKAQQNLPPTHQPYPMWPVALTVDTCQQTTNSDLLSNLRSGPINLLSPKFLKPCSKS